VKTKIIYLLISLLVFQIACTIEDTAIIDRNEESKMLKEKIEQFAKTKIKYDESILNAKQKVVVQKLFEVAKIMDEIFLEQVYSKNNEIKKELENSKSLLDRQRLDYYNIMAGPFDRLNHDKPFVGKKQKPLGANFYPEDMKKKEFLTWLKNHPEDETTFTSEFTMIRRDHEKLIAIPYSEYFRTKLTTAALLMNEAAEVTENPSLKKYLQLRAKAFSTNNYYESDMAWMDLKDHVIEVVIGPYEVYEDALFNYKASFECFLTIVDPVETKKLNKFVSYLNQMENNLPIPDKYKNFDRGSESPIMVVQEIFGGGDTKAGVQTLAFNLPNDERVRKAKGSKKVMLKNLHEAKFEKLLKPIAKIVLDESQQKYVTFNGFFNHTLMHEMSHGIGPGFITVNGMETEVKKELKETYSKIEECKADILGMFNNMFMIKHNEFPKEFEKEIWVTFLAGTFRSVRFGINEAHGGGNAIIYNYLLENGAYKFNSTTKKVKVNFEKIYSVLSDLATKILMIQAKGSYQGALDIIAKYGIESESMNILVDELSTLPVDIKPVFQIEE